MSAIFLTGFPGFLGSEMASRLLQRNEHHVEIHCLIQKKFRHLAEARAAEIEEKHDADGRIFLHEGDITDDTLGLGADARKALQQEVSEIYHFAAVYDLAVPREIGLRVNVDGTRHMLDFAEGCGNLKQFHYVSTCYVSGRHEGEFSESMLQEGQRFNNFYEETKYWAEVEAQRRMNNGLPVTIYRPAVVVGDSETGRTQKYDGPYYIIQWILRWKKLAPTPVVGNPEDYTLNVVPRDYVLNAMDHLSQHPESVGQVYHLSDPHPPTVSQMIASLGRASGRNILRIPISAPLAKKLLNSFEPLKNWIGIPPEAIDYFNHPTRYTCDVTRSHLEGSNIHCPAFSTYSKTLVDFVKANPSVASAAMA